jgi:hypothetical protein
MNGNRFYHKVLVIALVMGLVAAAGAMAAEETLTGTIMKNDSGMIIVSADDGSDYLVKGENLSDMVGKSVKVTGTLSEEADAKSITVMSMEELKE